MFFNFVAAAVLLRGWNVDFLRAQAIGALLTVAFNFVLNNAITFRSLRMRGARAFVGLVRFYAVCSVGLLAQLAVAGALQQFGVHWAPATIVGIVIGSVELPDRRAARLENPATKTGGLTGPSLSRKVLTVPPDVARISRP